MTKKFTTLLVLSIIATIIGYFVPPALLNLPTNDYGFMFGFVSGALVTATAAIWSFLTTLKAFKTSTKIAYYILAAGILFFTLTQIEQALIVVQVTLFPEVDLGYTLLSLIYLALYLAGAITMFLGVRKLARVLGVQSLWRSVWFTTGLATVTAVLAALLLNDPADPSAEVQASADIIFAVAAWASAFAASGALVARSIRNTISTSYRPAMGWLSGALAALAFSTSHEIFIKGTNFIPDSYSDSSFSIWPFFLSGILLMKASMVVKAATFKKLAANATYLDSVIYAAQLVSNPHEIDPTLNKLREVTAQIQPGKQLSTADKKTLLGVYRDIEEYLVTKEPLRKIAKPDLRARLTAEFQTELSQSEGGKAAPVAA